MKGLYGAAKAWYSYQIVYLLVPAFVKLSILVVSGLCTTKFIKSALITFACSSSTLRSPRTDPFES